jgi:hypothetical protein
MSAAIDTGPPEKGTPLAVKQAGDDDRNEIKDNTNYPNSQIEADGLPPIVSMDSFLVKDLPAVESADYGDDESDPKPWFAYVEQIHTNQLDKVTKGPTSAKGDTDG